MPCVPKSSSDSTSPIPKRRLQKRFTATRPIQTFYPPLARKTPSHRQLDVRLLGLRQGNDRQRLFLWVIIQVKVITLAHQPLKVVVANLVLAEADRLGRNVRGEKDAEEAEEEGAEEAQGQAWNEAGGWTRGWTQAWTRGWTQDPAESQTPG